jgi:hypothetical protein
MLTNPFLLHLFRRKGNYREHLCHYLAEQRYHVRGEWNARIDGETGEEGLDTFKKIDKN